MECAKFQGGRNEMVSGTKQAERDVNKTLKAVSTSLTAFCAQMYSTVEGYLD